jgi:hypothetical protein
MTTPFTTKRAAYLRIHRRAVPWFPPHAEKLLWREFSKKPLSLVGSLRAANSRR